MTENVIDRFAVKSKKLSNGILRNAILAHFSNLKNVFIRQFAPIIFFTPKDWSVPSVFVFHVCHVLLMGSQEQMLWIYAFARIASMKAVHALRDFSKMQLPRKSMGANHFTVYAKSSVSLTFFRTNPKPTGPSLFDFSPKAYFGAFSFHGSAT